MSDYCYSRLTCRLKDAFRFSAIGYHLEELVDNDCIAMVDEQADFGHSDELEELAGEGPIFYGYSANGDEYPAEVFAADGVEYASCDTIVPDANPALEMYEDGTIVGQQEASDYWRVWNSARKKLIDAGESPAVNTIG